MHAHARIQAIDASVARSAPGVLAVLTGADLARDGLGTMQMTLKRKRQGLSPHTQVLENLELFAAKVIPRFR